MLRSSATMKQTYEPFFEEKLETSRIEHEKLKIVEMIDLLNFYSKSWDFRTETFDLEWYLQHFQGIKFQNEYELSKAVEELNSKVILFDSAAVNHPFIVISKKPLLNKSLWKNINTVIGAYNEKFITYRDIIMSLYDSRRNFTLSYGGKDEYNRIILLYKEQ